MAKEKLKKDGTKSRQGEGGSGRKPLKWENPKELENYIEQYYKWAKDNDMKITVTGLAWWLDCSRTTLLNYENSDENDWLKRCSDEERKGYVNTIKKAKRFIEMNYENSLFDKSSTTGAIFTLKNNYNWVDRQEVVNKEDNNINITLEDEEE
ncbi:terminase small subunit [Clostridium sp. JNZ J1-5]